MTIAENVSLADYSTMRLGGPARYLATVQSEDELTEALSFARQSNVKIHICGGGSNTIFSDSGFDGLVIVNRILGISENVDGDTLELHIGGGENWDDVVALSVERGYFDIAALSLIPGTAGAAPVQNIGAYGQQVSDGIVSVRAYDVKNGEFVEILKQDCNFSYRHSRFNTADKGRFIITNIKLQLHRKSIRPPFYADVESYFQQHGVDSASVSPQQLREAVSTVRVIKLPDPRTIANTGSFFKNPVVTPEGYENLIARFPNLKAHQTDDGNLKLYAGQLIELAGLKDYHHDETGMATWKNQALVLVNESAESTRDLLKFKELVVDTVQKIFEITLVQEPELV